MIEFIGLLAFGMLVVTYVVEGELPPPGGSIVYFGAYLYLAMLAVMFLLAKLYQWAGLDRLL